MNVVYMVLILSLIGCGQSTLESDLNNIVVCIEGNKYKIESGLGDSYFISKIEGNCIQLIGVTE